MSTSSSPARSTAVAVMVCNGLIGLQYMASVVTRDALFLSSVDAAARPLMVGLSSGLLVLLTGVILLFHRRPLSLIVAVMFGISTALMLLAFVLVASQPSMAARAFFLQTTGLGPILGSLFWIITSDRSNPRSARSGFGRIMGVGTFGGLIGALAAGQLPSWLGIGAMLPLLAVVNMASGALLWRLARVPSPDDEPSGESDSDAIKRTLRLDYVPVIAVVVVLGSAGSAFVEHLVNVQAQAVLPKPTLPAFFSTYYMAVAIVGLVVQTTLTERAINTLGLGLMISSSWMVLAAGSLAALFFPGLVAMTATYGLGSVVHDSFFKKAYELFFTPASKTEKRVFKLIADGVFSRTGAAVGAGLIAILTALAPMHLYTGLLLAAVLCAGGAVLLARPMSGLYIAALERSLFRRAADLGDTGDITTRTVGLRAAPSARRGQIGPGSSHAEYEPQDVQALRSGDFGAVMAVLQRHERPGAALIAHIIPLLAWNAVAEDAVRALRAVADQRTGELLDALLDADQPFAVRRRLARVFSACTSQRAADGVLIGLDDARFEVRFECARSLAAMLEKNPRLRIDRERVYDVVRREMTVGRPVWTSRQLLQTLDGNPQAAFVDGFVNNRAEQSLAHVFTLLSLVLPAAPLRLAYRAVHTDDSHLRGTALEYLGEVLPPEIDARMREALGEVPRPHTPRTASREAILADLLKSNEAILSNLEELRRRASATGTAPPDKGTDGH
jgi:hypothetical protein